jgi:hypothetical protein
MIFLFSSFKLMQKVLAVGPLQITKSSKLSRIKSIFDAHKECRCFDLGQHIRVSGFPPISNVILCSMVFFFNLHFDFCSPVVAKLLVFWLHHIMNYFHFCVCVCVLGGGGVRKI